MLQRAPWLEIFLPLFRMLFPKLAVALSLPLRPMLFKWLWAQQQLEQIMQLHLVGAPQIPQLSQRLQERLKGLWLIVFLQLWRNVNAEKGTAGVLEVRALKVGTLGQVIQVATLALLANRARGNADA